MVWDIVSRHSTSSPPKVVLNTFAFTKVQIITVLPTSVDKICRHINFFICAITELLDEGIWIPPIIRALGRLGQEDRCEFETSLGYIVSLVSTI